MDGQERMKPMIDQPPSDRARRILFVCTGNIFRSMIAEHALRAALGDDRRYQVGSAGTEAEIQEMMPRVRERLLERGIDPSAHRQRRLTLEMLEEADLVVAMGLDHRQFIRSQWGRQVLLFNQACHDREEPVLDLWEALPDWQENPEGANAYVSGIVDSIIDAMPALIRRLDRLTS
jgi:protein-tyrosine-phosphatase